VRKPGCHLRGRQCCRVTVAHVEADDFAEAEAGSERKGEDEVVAGVAGGRSKKRGLLGCGKGVGAAHRHGANGAGTGSGDADDVKQQLGVRALT
jgi:hypothetical protein